LLEIQDPKIAIWAPSHNFVGYIFATKAHIDTRKKKKIIITGSLTEFCQTF